MTNDQRIMLAIAIAYQYAGIDGADQKQWVIDQMMRVLLGHAYDKWVEDWEDGEDGPKTHEWETGIAP